MLALQLYDEKGAHEVLEGIAAGESLITSPDQAFDVMDFEPAARKALPPAHLGMAKPNAHAPESGYSFSGTVQYRLLEL